MITIAATARARHSGNAPETAPDGPYPAQTLIASPPHTGRPKKDTSAATLASLLQGDWNERTAAATASPNHVSSLARWLPKAREARPDLNDDQAERLALMMRKAHYVKMGKLSAQARKLAREAQAELDGAPPETAPGA